MKTMACALVMLFGLGCVPVIAQESPETFSMFKGLIDLKKDDSTTNKTICLIKGGACLFMAIGGWSQNTNYGFLAGSYFTYRFSVNIGKATFGYR